MPQFSIPLSGLTASSTAMSTIANNMVNAENARNAALAAVSQTGNLSLLDYLSKG
jgi:hypothetical protein